MWRWGDGRSPAFYLVVWLAVCLLKTVISKCMLWQAKLKSIIWIRHTRTQSKTQLSRLHYTPLPSPAASWLPDCLSGFCLSHHDKTAHKYISESSVKVGTTDCQHFQLALTLLSIWPCLHSEILLDPGDHHPFAGLVFCFLPGFLLPPLKILSIAVF